MHVIADAKIQTIVKDRVAENIRGITEDAINVNDASRTIIGVPLGISLKVTHILFPYTAIETLRASADKIKAHLYLQKAVKEEMC